MKNNWPAQDQVFWYLNRDTVAPLSENMAVDVAIIGGGMAGLSAALAFVQRGKKVMVLEQYYCGAGASGKSSGFITPNAELSLTDFTYRYNVDVAGQIWKFITSGVNDIRNNIHQFNLNCDYLPQNTIILANKNRHMHELRKENENLEKLGYKTKFFNQSQVKNYVGSDAYFGGVEYEDTFGLDGYLYCQEMKKVLQQKGVLIFEETPVTAINGHVLTTLHGNVTADTIIVCTDRFMPELGLLKKEVYHVQTFLMISQQLPESIIKQIFPKDPFMAWDTDFIYTYFRIAYNGRLLLGGGNMLSTYGAQEYHNYKPMFKKLTRYLDHKFPYAKVQFEQFWPGLIGLSKDIGPIAGRDKDKPYMYYVSASAGLPIATALGRYSAEHMIDGRTDLDPYFSPYRSFPIGSGLQTIIGTRASFAISNLIKKYWP